MRKSHMAWKRSLALLCLVILLCMLLPPIHDCSGKDCAICALISVSKNVFTFVFLYALFLDLGDQVCKFYTFIKERMIHRNDTLVLQKVKLSN
ncbi:MAG: hypothetical protein ACI3VU_06100 [Faecousia sp.]|nr:hypothetical protein [Bacillota bacterium]